jgi:hypothetical protein
MRTLAIVAFAVALPVAVDARLRREGNRTLNPQIKRTAGNYPALSSQSLPSELHKFD